MNSWRPAWLELELDVHQDSTGPTTLYMPGLILNKARLVHTLFSKSSIRVCDQQSSHILRNQLTPGNVSSIT